MNTGAQQPSSFWPTVEESEGGWPEIDFPSARLDADDIAPDRMLLSLALSIDLRKPAEEITGYATAAFDPTIVQRQPESKLVFFLNPGLNIESVTDGSGKALDFSTEGERVSTIVPDGSTGDTAFFLLVRYRGTLLDHSLFGETRLSSGTVIGDPVVLPHESLWYPWFPGQGFAGNLHVLTDAGVDAWSVAAPHEIIENRGTRTSRFSWAVPAGRLALATGPWIGGQMLQSELILDVAVAPEMEWLRGSLAPVLLQKADFFGRAFYPLPFDRFTIVGRTNDSPAADGRAIVILPRETAEIRLLGTPLVDRLLARQWFGELLRFHPAEEWVEQGWADYAARMHLEDVFQSRAKVLWELEGQKLTSAAEPDVPLEDKFPWVLRMLRCRMGRPAFWELNQEFFQRNLYRRVGLEDYTALAEEIQYWEPVGSRMKEIVEPWVQDDSIPILACSWETVDGATPTLELTIEQLTPEPWPLEIPVEITSTSEGVFEISETLTLSKTVEVFSFEFATRRADVQLDPDWTILCKRIYLSGKGIMSDWVGPAATLK